MNSPHKHLLLTSLLISISIKQVKIQFLYSSSPLPWCVTQQAVLTSGNSRTPNTCTTGSPPVEHNQLRRKSVTTQLTIQPKANQNKIPIGHKPTHTSACTYKHHECAQNLAGVNSGPKSHIHVIHAQSNTLCSPQIWEGAEHHRNIESQR